MVSRRHAISQRGATHELITTVDIHEAVQQVEDLNPQYANIGLEPVPSLEMHERLAQQRRRSQTCLGHAHRIAEEDLRLQELVQKREHYAIEQLLDLVLIFLVQEQVRAKNDALKIDESCVSDFPRGVV